MWSESDGERENEIMSTSSRNSEVVRMDERAIACASNTVLPAANLQFIKSKGIHVGDQFVSVTQTVHNNEVVKGRFLGLELVSAKSTRKLRCSIAVFVCWALVVASGLAFYMFHFALYRQQFPLDLDIHEPWYLRRGDWQAMPAYRQDYLDLPVKFVIVGHSASHYCTEKYTCIEYVMDIQKDHLMRRWDDIGPHFLISGNGIVFEGRAPNIFPAMVLSWNRKSIMIMFMGDYRYNEVDNSQFEHISIVLEELVKKKVLVPDYTMWANCQVSPHIISPGPNIMKRLDFFSHWNPTNSSFCLPG